MPIDLTQNSGHHAALRRLRAELAFAETIDGLPRGLIGAVHRDHGAVYVYPEIAGYWLRWAAPRRDVAFCVGESVIDWLKRHQRRDGGLPTRLGDCGPPYRRALYLFDHVMLWDGLRQWDLIRGSKSAARMADRVLQFTECFHVRGQLRPALGSDLPRRWSALGGGFLLKACARLRDAPGALAAACARNVDALQDLADRGPHTEAHPQLYAIEGLIELGRLESAARLFDRLIEAHGGIGCIHEAPGSPVRRNDVLAQALRAACLLKRVEPDHMAWSMLANELANAVDATGRLPFVAGDPVSPTWTALFAEQALSLWTNNFLDPLPLV